ncbi:hypothetical protein OH76DRAFT_242360 [Lentinus brumalis]|uniref:Uncharacterized protein n=1 Tax=Lentinus brumalis TaxID=2498619 RepID=A0A371DHR4_9APHY|nr:hypothetical protein OH76DRAFT_242360 [Polyporus brumalis]
MAGLHKASLSSKHLSRGPCSETLPANSVRRPCICRNKLQSPRTITSSTRQSWSLTTIRVHLRGHAPSVRAYSHVYRGISPAQSTYNFCASAHPISEWPNAHRGAGSHDPLIAASVPAGSVDPIQRALLRRRGCCRASSLAVRMPASPVTSTYFQNCRHSQHLCHLSRTSQYQCVTALGVYPSVPHGKHEQQALQLCRLCHRSLRSPPNAALLP